MTEPRRLLEQDATAVERVLLSSAHADGPPAGAAQRTLLALQGLPAGGGDPDPWGAGTALGDSTSAVPMAAQSMKLGALAKVGLAALVGAGAFGGGLLVHGLASRGAAPVQRSAPSVRTTQAASVPGPAEDFGAKVPAPSQSAPAETGGVGRQPLLGPSDDALRAELRVLDQARAAVDARDPAAAQRALDSYTQRFPQGHLKPEAAVLRLAVLVQQGDRAAAKSLAAQLLASETYRTYEPRIRFWLRKAEH